MAAYLLDRSLIFSFLNQPVWSLRQFDPCCGDDASVLTDRCAQTFINDILYLSKSIIFLHLALPNKPASLSERPSELTVENEDVMLLVFRC